MKKPGSLKAGLFIFRGGQVRGSWFCKPNASESSSLSRSTNLGYTIEVSQLDV
jgi:hypothetical protein